MNPFVFYFSACRVKVQLPMDVDELGIWEHPIMCLGLLRFFCLTRLHVQTCFKPTWPTRYIMYLIILVI